MNVGILGFGFMGQAHYLRYQDINEANVVAIADSDLEKLLAEDAPEGNLDLGLKKLDLSSKTTYSKAEDLIADTNVEIVDVCLPTFLHKKYVNLALDKGKHVICEKPLALNSFDADEMIEKARENRCNLLVAQVIRFWPEYKYLSNLIGTGEYGKLLFLNMFRRTSIPDWTWEDWNKDFSKSGGLLDIRIHELDYVNHIFGLPSRLFCESTAMKDAMSSLYNFSSGLRITVESNRLLPKQLNFEDGFDAYFENALLRYRGQQKNKLQLFKVKDNVPINLDFFEDAYLEELKYFINLIISNKEVDLSYAEQAKDALRLWEMENNFLEKGVIM